MTNRDKLLETRIEVEEDRDETKSIGLQDKPYLPLQVKEIEEHAYFMGQNSDKPISMDDAAMDWITSKHSDRFRKDYAKHRVQILKYCAHHCGNSNNCSGIDSITRKSLCDLNMREIHELLEDWESPDVVACEKGVYDIHKNYRFAI